MDAELFWEIAAIFILILGNGFFALSEFSIIASRKSKLQQRAAQGKRGAQQAEKLHSNPDRFLATIQIGITLVGTLAGVFGGATLVDPLQELLRSIPVDVIASTATTLSVVIVSIGITVTAVVLGELVPKYIALSDPERYASIVAPLISLFTRLTGIFTMLLSGAANMVVRMIGLQGEKSETHITEEEINLMIFEGKQKGIFDETEEQLIKNVFDFADSTVRRAMTPRTDVVALPYNTPPEEIVRTVIENGHSKYPVYEKNIDNIVGILYTKDLIHHKLNPNLIVLSDLIRKPTFVPDSMPLSKLLRDFQRKKNQFAVVLDEFGGTAGIITIEDILEELVGEIQDEDDTKEQPLVKHSDTVVFADGAVWPGAVNELIGSHLPEDKVETLAGLVIDHIGRLPHKGESIVIEDMKITVLTIEHNRLTRLKLELITPTEEKES